MTELTMPTKYDPQATEAGRYEWWLQGKFSKHNQNRGKSRIQS